MTFKEGVKEASPVNLHSIGKKTHVTVELGMLIRGVVIVAAVVAGYMNFMVRIDRAEAANEGLRKQLVARDSLMRKDIQATLKALHTDLSTNTAGLAAAFNADMKEVKTALSTETATMVATTQANSEKADIELDNLKSLIVSANSTTYGELNQTIGNVQNALDLQARALNQRISLIEDQLRDQVKRSLFGRFSKK